ncbi:hypothetical protein ACFU9F_05095 [Streptomyces zhihengii]|uniref:Uncharacterized protein n=1 Tax=Streptomyces zhihengii TaxID=1818004 RepID=A0ABS2UYM8_9ACTN|nr:hypothetical protein [Streptomyces zhihengii]MBM9622484.1 hypothetical protein [Streptomyces zhihengii]
MSEHVRPSALLDAYLSPAARDALPAGGRARLIAQEALRIRWHQLFDRVPALTARLGDTVRVYDAFLEWADAGDRVLDWRMHLHFLDHLTEREVPLDEADHTELLAAAAARWFAASGYGERGLALTSSLLAPKVVVGVKGAGPLDRARVKLARVPGLEPEQGVRWCLSPRGDFGEFVWRTG